jgi:uncharacterized protein
VLLAVAAATLQRNRVLAVTARSPTYPALELKTARAIARRLKVRHLVTESSEFNDPNFLANPPRRCYYCKSELYSQLRRIAAEQRLSVVLDGTNYDDRRDYRPGRQAARAYRVRSPLLQAHLTKTELRILARRYNLPNWDKPATACLASRIPYGTSLDEKLLRRIDQAERLLRRLGFTQVRLRHHDRIARIEIPPVEFTRIIRPATTARVVRRLRLLGYDYVTLDLAGYQTGSMNKGAARGRNHR